MKNEIENSSVFYKIGSLHLYLVPVFFILFTLNQASNIPAPIEILLGLGLISLFTFSVYFIAKLFLKNHVNTAIFTTIALLLLLFFGNISSSLKAYKFLLIFNRSRYTLIIIIGVISFMVYYFLKNKNDPKTKFNLLLSCILIFYILSESFVFMGFKPKDAPLKITAENISTDINSLKLNDTKNSIYFLLLDAYSSNYALKKYWQFDNKIFSQMLRQNNFIVFDSAVSSYNTTIRSVTSILNMNYLPASLNELPETVQKNTTLGNLISDNSLVKLLQASDYKIYNYSIFDFKNHPKKNYKYVYLEESFLFMLYTKTVFKNLVSGFVENMLIDETTSLYHLQTLSNMIKAAKDQSDSMNPKFVYCHLLLPHEPYILDSIGQIKMNYYPMNDQPDAYLEQLKYANKIVSDAVKQIISADSSAVIIITGDHGYRYFLKDPEYSETAFSAFTAIRIPNGRPTDKKSKISSPNIFRYILKENFGVPIDLLKDSSNFYK